MGSSSRHKWGAKQRLAYKTEQECQRCGLIKVTRHESEAGRDVYWGEWWRDLEQIRCDATPSCDARLEAPNA